MNKIIIIMAGLICVLISTHLVAAIPKNNTVHNIDIRQSMVAGKINNTEYTNRIVSSQPSIGYNATYGAQSYLGIFNRTYNVTNISTPVVTPPVTGGGGGNYYQDDCFSDDDCYGTDICVDNNCVLYRGEIIDNITANRTYPFFIVPINMSNFNFSGLNFSDIIINYAWNKTNELPNTISDKSRSFWAWLVEICKVSWIEIKRISVISYQWFMNLLYEIEKYEVKM